MKTVRWINPREDDKILHVETPLGIVNRVLRHDSWWYVPVKSPAEALEGM